jgi:hypothetical protein
MKDFLNNANSAENQEKLRREIVLGMKKGSNSALYFEKFSSFEPINSLLKDQKWFD